MERAMADYGMLVAGAAIGLVSSGFAALLTDSLARKARRDERDVRAETAFHQRSREAMERLVELVEDDWRKVARGEDRSLSDAQAYTRLHRRALAALPTDSPVRSSIEEMHSVMQGLTIVKKRWDEGILSPPEVEAELSDLNKRMQSAASDLYRGLAELLW
ncbi:MAG: hypothetical protein IH609_21350 [Dehalococcoidia bacterium]|nr:hypothetical protein [Dehalococcoidia bacterium]